MLLEPVQHQKDIRAVDQWKSCPLGTVRLFDEVLVRINLQTGFTLTNFLLPRTSILVVRDKIWSVFYKAISVEYLSGYWGCMTSQFIESVKQPDRYPKLTVIQI